jgi:hypothetical protein
MWGVHIKCIPLYCNADHELEGTEIITKCTWVGYMIKFVTYILQMFNKGTAE